MKIFSTFKQFILVAMSIIILAGAIFYYATKHKQRDSTKHAYRVAIFEPASHPAMDEISQGFIDTVIKNGAYEYTFKRYNANNNATLMRSLAEEIIQQNYDLIMTIGAGASKTIQELITKKKLTTPLVFDAVSDPAKLGIVGDNVTGIEESSDFEDQINKLLTVKPDTKTILLVYDPVSKAGVHEVWSNQIKKIAAKKGITTLSANVFSVNEIQAKVQPLLQQADTVLIFTDHTTVSGIDSLITLCNRYGVTLYASDLNSGDKGAALSYGLLQYDLGVDAAQLALEILDNHIQPLQLPIRNPKSVKLKINTKTMTKQGLKISDAQLADIKNSGGIVI